MEVVVVGGDGAEPVDGDPRRAATYVEKIHQKIVEGSAWRLQFFDYCVR
jgi:hypothetical protein